TGTPDENYTYDLSGNRIGSHLHNNYLIGQHNTVESAGDTAYNYDPEGNLIRAVDPDTGRETTYTWDHRNRLVEALVKDLAGNLLTTVTYAYDALNRRVTESVTDHMPLPQQPIHSLYINVEGGVLLELR